MLTFLILLAQTPVAPAGPIFTNPATLSRQFAFFEFAPPEGTGMGAACACTTPTGAKGETMTFTRASSGTCLKGGTLTGIANGDLVTCSSNQPRVMPGGDGTGGNGLLVEGARTNDLPRSEEFDNAAWAKVGNGAAAPTVTANQATAPDGTLTADRVQFPATTTAGSQYTILQQDVASLTRSQSLFIKGNGQSGTLHLYQENPTCVVCSYVATTWTRCALENQATTIRFYVGVDPTSCGGGDQTAKDVFLWGAQSEVGAFASSYIATAGAAVTRADELATFSLSLANTEGSFAVTIVPPAAAAQLSAGAVDRGMLTLSSAGPTFRYLLDYQAAAFFYINAGGGGSVSSAYSVVANTPARFAGYWDSTNRTVVTQSGSNTNATPGTAATTLVEIGTYGGAFNHIFSAVKRACVDPLPTRCR